MRNSSIIVKVIALCLSCIITAELLLMNSASIISADEEIESFTLELYSNVYGAGDYIDVYESDGEYFISVEDLAFLTRCQIDDNNSSCSLTQGIWSVTIDFEKRLFDDEVYQPSEISIHTINNIRVVPAVELMSYFGATYIKVDLKNGRFYCLMPNYTAWEALDVDYNLTLKNSMADKTTKIFNVLTEMIMGDATTAGGYRKRAYNEVLAVDMMSNEGVKEFIEQVEEENNEFFCSEKGLDIVEDLDAGNNGALPSKDATTKDWSSTGEEIEESLNALDFMGKGVATLVDAVYGHESTWLRELYSNSSAGVLSEEYKYSQTVFDTIRDKVEGPINIADKGIAIASGLMNIVNTSYAEFKAIESTDNLVGRVMGNEEELLNLSADLDESWIKTAEEYNSKAKLIGRNTIRAIAEKVADYCVDRMLKEGFEKSGVAAQAGLLTGRWAMNTLPFTKGSYESSKADLSAIILCDLQEQLLKIIKQYYETIDFSNNEEINKLVDAIILYCRTSMAIYQELLLKKEAEGFHIEHWKSKYQPKIDLAATSLYKLYTYSGNASYRVRPLNYAKLTEDVRNNKKAWIVVNEESKVDLYDYRYTNIFELVNMIGGMEGIAGEGYIYGNSVVTVAAFSKDLSMQETNYIMIDKDDGYIFCGISIGESRKDAEEKLATLGYTLYSEGAYGKDSWKEYLCGTEKIGLRFDGNGSITRISWDETADWDY